MSYYIQVHFEPVSQREGPQANELADNGDNACTNLEYGKKS